MGHLSRSKTSVLLTAGVCETVENGASRTSQLLRTRKTRRKARLVGVLACTVAITTVMAGCGPPHLDSVSDNLGGTIVLLASGSANEPQPSLTPTVRRILLDAALNTPATDTLDGSGATATLATMDLQTLENHPLTPRREDGRVERGMQREQLIRENVGVVEAAVGALRAQQSGIDALEAIAQNTRGLNPGTLVVISNGLSTGGGFDMRAVGWHASAEDIVTQLRDRRLLPRLAGWRVIFTGIGSTAGEQVPISAPSRETLVGYWLAICKASDAVSCEVDNSRLPATPPSAGPATPTVAVDGITSVVGPNGQTTTTLSDAVLGFAADSSDLGPAAKDVLEQTSARINIVLADRPGAPITVSGWTADPPGATPQGLATLSQARAQAVADALAAYGVTNPIRAIGGGAAPDMTANVNGRFDEAIAALMRRSEISY